jgi:hypothetical protein
VSPATPEERRCGFCGAEPIADCAICGSAADRVTAGYSVRAAELDDIDNVPERAYELAELARDHLGEEEGATVAVLLCTALREAGFEARVAWGSYETARPQIWGHCWVVLDGNIVLDPTRNAAFGPGLDNRPLPLAAWKPGNYTEHLWTLREEPPAEPTAFEARRFLCTHVLEPESVIEHSTVSDSQRDELKRVNERVYACAAAFGIRLTARDVERAHGILPDVRVELSSQTRGRPSPFASGAV